jgi:hypothetical protein
VQSLHVSARLWLLSPVESPFELARSNRSRVKVDEVSTGLNSIIVLFVKQVHLQNEVGSVVLIKGMY